MRVHLLSNTENLLVNTNKEMTKGTILDKIYDEHDLGRILGLMSRISIWLYQTRIWEIKDESLNNKNVFRYQPQPNDNRPFNNHNKQHMQPQNSGQFRNNNFFNRYHLSNIATPNVRKL